MKKYRIVRNKYNYFKIQRLFIINFFSKIIYKEWIDIRYQNDGRNIMIFESYEYAQLKMDKLITIEHKKNND